MARLNIEEPFWIEVIRLVGKVGDEDRAIGCAIRFFRFAQQKHKAGLLITEEEFKRQGFVEDLIPLFAERVEGGIQAHGAEKHFGWLAEKVEAGQTGGRISAQRPRDDKGRLLPKQTPSTIQAEPSTHQPSPSPSSSIKKLNTAAVVAPRARKKIEKFFPENLNALKQALDQETIQFWQDVYPDKNYREREAVRCWEYYREAGAKKPTTLGGWKKVMGSWFERGWAKHIAGVAHPNGKQGPAPIRHKPAEAVFAEQEASRESPEDRRGDPEAVANVKALLASIPSLGGRKTGA